MAREDHRPARLIDQLEGALEIFRLRKMHGLVAARLRRRGLPIEFAGRILRVLGDVDQHRPRAARRRDMKCLAQTRRDVLGARDKIIVLSDRERDAGDVGFLKRVAANELAAHLARDADDGEESIIAVAMPVTIFVAPGPDVAIATPTPPPARAKPSAMCVAPCSWRTRM